jgi:hypothetical protein
VNSALIQIGPATRRMSAIARDGEDAERTS